MTLDDVLRNDPNYSDERAIAGDFVDLMNELADLLSSDAASGEFGRHGPFLARADALIEKLGKTVDPHVLDLYRVEAESAIARLRGAFQLVDVQGRA